MTDDEREDLTDDILKGAEAIRAYVRAKNVDEVYYAARMGLLPIGKYGKFLFASKRRIDTHRRKLMQGA